MNKLDLSRIKSDGCSTVSLTQCMKGFDIILYGAGEICRGTISLMKKHGLFPTAVCDTRKAGRDFCGYTVQDINSLKSIYKNPRIVICSIQYYHEIKEYLLSLSDGPAILFGIDEINRLTLECGQADFLNMMQSGGERLNKIYSALGDGKSRSTLENIIKGKACADVSAFKAVYCPDQYFPEDIIRLGKNERFADGGAFIGDTAEIFIKKTNNVFNKIYCFEPSKSNFKKLSEMKEKYADDRIVPFNMGLYSENARLGFSDDGLSSSNSLGVVNTNTTDTVALDSAVKDEVTFIKMDIEGAELDALKGARQTILKYKPKLAICVYHKNEDIIEIPEYIMSMGLDYKYYLRHHSPDSIHETVFYAV